MPTRIVVLGGGVGGTLAANLLARGLAHADVEITVADRTGKHVYQPGWLYIPFGQEHARNLVRNERGLLDRRVNLYWYRVGPAGYVAAALVDPLVPPTPPRTYAGHWVDVNLTQFLAIAYDADRPVYAAIITAGRDGATPTGVFQVIARVRNETMDSATVGIPKGTPHYYRLTNVQYTQYFKDGGYALHQNYWTPSDQFGNYSTNGCVGLLLPDAAWFWDFLSIGSTVSVHA